jgi:putative aldouronate transport system substrate-binding protein
MATIIVTATTVVTAAVITLTAFTLVSCGGKKTTGTSTVSTPKTVDYSEHETFTVWLMADTTDFYNDYSDNPVVWWLNKNFNVTLKFEQPVQGTESDSLSLMFGTGEYTDMINIIQYTGSIQELYNNDVIVNIADYLDYMPNYKKLLEKYPDFRRAAYNDNGQILQLGGMGKEGAWFSAAWGGLVYRYDILKDAAGGNIRFPSGNDYPKTIEDWEYMLPLFKQYFESRGVTDYAPLILPASGCFIFGDLVNSFGGQVMGYLDSGKVKNGFYEDTFYKYLQKMREWYAKGWIYQDFASRTNDVFYLPNTALTYGGSAGVWYGLSSQLGDKRSMPQYGMFFDVRPIPSPLSTADGVTEFANFIVSDSWEYPGYSFTTKCENLPKLLSIMDYLFSEEGSLLFAGGLTKELGAAENPVMVKFGLQDGMWWLEDGKKVINPALQGKEALYLAGYRLSGLNSSNFFPETFERDMKITVVWAPYQDPKIKKVPGAISYTAEEEKSMSAKSVQINDYVNSMIPKFIMGTAPLNDQTWADFKAQLKALGVEENIRITQAAYERYLKR